MSLVTVSEFAARVETAVDFADLTALLDRIEAEIVAQIGIAYVDANTTTTETHQGDGGRNLLLKRRILTMGTVTEYASIGATGSVLTENSDYAAWINQGRLERVGNWGWKVVVAYVPQDDREKWREAIIDIARIDLARSPMKAENIAGEMGYTSPDSWERERAMVMHRLMFPEV